MKISVREFLLENYDIQSMTFSNLSDDDRTINLLGALALSLMDALSDAAAANVGYGGETAAAIVTLGAEPGLSINTLRQILNLSHPGTVRLVDRLQAQGWVERRSGSDGRTLALFLTEIGQLQRHALLTQRRQQLQPALDSLTTADRQQLVPLLEKMLAALTTSELQAFAICRLCEEEVCPGDRCPVEQKYCQLIQSEEL